MQINTFQKRKSIRRFSTNLIEHDKLLQLMNFETNSHDIFRPPNRYTVWLSGKTLIAETLSKFLLSYGKIISAPYLLAPFCPDVDLNQILIGFELEHVVLKATELGLGSLWVSVDNAQNVIQEMVLKIKNDPANSDNSKILNELPANFDTTIKTMNLPVVVLLGYPSERRLDRVINNSIRMESAGNSRKKVESLIVNRRPEGLNDKLKKVFNLAVLAPSKKNQQPWRIRLKNGGFDLGCIHERRIDMGIFLAHLTIAMNHYSIQFSLKQIEEKQDDIQWHISVAIK